MQTDALIMQTTLASLFSKEGGKALQQLMQKVENVG